MNKTKFTRLSALVLAASVLAACSASNTPSGLLTTAETLTTAVSQTQLAPIDVDNVPTYAVRPSQGAVSISGQLRIPAGLILSPTELSSITAPPQGITAPPQGITAPPQGITAPPLGFSDLNIVSNVLASQPVFGIKSVKMAALSQDAWTTFFRDNFKLALPDQQAFINNTVLQVINGQPYFVANYVLPQVQPNMTLKLEATRPNISMSATIYTGDANQTLASDIDFGTTTLDLVRSAAQAQNKKLDFSYINAHLSDLETVSVAMQKRFKNEISQAELDQAVQAFVADLPAYNAPKSIQIQGQRTLRLKQGEVLQLEAITQFERASQSSAAWWSSNAGNIVNVLSDGSVVAVNPGKAIIKASAIDNPDIADNISLEVY